MKVLPQASKETMTGLVYATFVGNRNEHMRDRRHGRRRYQEVHSRSQVMLLPPCLDDYVSENNVVRAIDAFVGTLDLQALGFEHAEASCGAGQPAFDPALLLKLYLYGYQHRVRSSRRLEAETRRNLEVIWLCQRASPSYKTIADFRKNNAAALQAANREFVLLCRELSLLGGSRVAIDGTFMKADANSDSFHTKATLERQLKRLDERIAAYHRQLDEADARSEDCAETAEDPELAAKIEALVEKQRNRKELQERLRKSGEGQVSEIDADARLLSKHGKTVGGYNCQIAVDDKHKLVVAEDVVQDGNDSRQLEPMMTKAGEATDNGRLIGFGGWRLLQRRTAEELRREGNRGVCSGTEAGVPQGPGDSAATISVTTPGMTRMSVRPDSGWFEAARPPTRASCISIITRRQQIAAVVRCRSDVWQREHRRAECSAGSMSM